MKTHSRHRLISLIGIPLVLLSACQGTVSGPSDSSTDSADDFVIGMDAAYAPFCWLENEPNPGKNVPVKGKANEYAAGYDIQVASYVAKDNGWNLKVVVTPWDNLIPSLQSGAIDAIVAGLSNTQDRRQSIDFSVSYYQSSVVLVARKDNSIFPETGDWDFEKNLKGVKLITLSGAFEDDLCQDWAKDYGANYINSVEEYSFAFLQVFQGKADAVVAELPVALSYVMASPDMRVVAIDNSRLDVSYQEQTQIAMGLRKNDEERKAKIDVSLSKLSSETRDSWMAQAIEDSGE